MRSIARLLRIGFLAGVVLGLATLALGGIEGSVHDFQSELNITEICVVCHTPHNAKDPVANNLDYAPLWNHEVSTTGPYTLYSSSTLDHTPGQPDGPSKLCLSCHDGSVAVDNYGGTTTGNIYVDDVVFDGTPGSSVGAARDFGSALDNDHPISFLYDPVAGSDNEIYPSTALTSLGGTIAEDLLVDNKVQCSSCHDVHDVDGNAYLLTISNAASQLCLTCHAK